MDWLVELSAALGSVQRNAPLIATLATVDWRGQPRGRSIVCRRIHDDGSIWIASDARSEKNVHLRESKMAELVIWLPSPREQFRLFGDVTVLGIDTPSSKREELWQQLTDASRAMFTWPTPGSPRLEGETFASDVKADAAVPETFEVLILHPTIVERLELQPHPHARTRWQKVKAWQKESLNP